MKAKTETSVRALAEAAEMADQSFRKKKSKSDKSTEISADSKTPPDCENQEETTEFKKGWKGNAKQNELDTKINDDGRDGEEKVEEDAAERLDHSKTTGTESNELLAASATKNTADVGSQHGSAASVSSKVPRPEIQDPEEALKVTGTEPLPGIEGGIFSRKNLIIGALALVAILLAVVLAVVINKSDSSSPLSNSLSPITAPTPSQNEENGACIDATCGFLIGILKTSHPEQTWEKISTEETCQNSALHWLSQTQDILSIDPAMVRHRYALATTYCELVTVENGNRGLQSTQKESWITNVVFGRPTEACFGDSNLGPRAFNPNCQSGVVNLDGQRQQHLTGTLAPELSMASSLREIVIKNGSVKGSIPEEYGRFELLETLDLSNNELAGLIPSSIVIPSLQVLLLNGNHFFGTFTIDVNNAANLVVISIFDNSLSGDFSDVCTLVDEGNLSLFAADVNKVGCECCTPTLPPDFSSFTLTSAPITATPSVGGNFVFATLNPSTASATTAPSAAELDSPLTSPPTVTLIVAAPPPPTNLPTSKPLTGVPSNDTELPGLTNFPTIEPSNLETAPTNLPVDPLVDSPVEASGPSSFTMSRPFTGTTTTAMDPYVPEDCYFEDNILPNIINQCECFGSINSIPEDVENLYNPLRENIVNSLYNGVYANPANDCDPVNKALFWLSTGNTRDAGDLYQRFILALTFFATNGTGWDSSNLWLSDESECMYYGVQCDGSFQVNSIELTTNNLFGSIPSEIRHLNGLQTLSLGRNHLSGTIPTEMYTMKSIESIQLYANQLVGSMPTEIGSASNLKQLRLENNMLFGAVSTEIGKVSNLEELDISFNEFFRTIPTESKLDIVP